MHIAFSLRRFSSGISGGMFGTRSRANRAERNAQDTNYTNGVRNTRSRGQPISKSDQPSKKKPRSDAIDQNHNDVEHSDTTVSSNGSMSGSPNEPKNENSGLSTIMQRINGIYQLEYANMLKRLHIKMPIKCAVDQMYCNKTHQKDTVSVLKNRSYCSASCIISGFLL